MYEAVNLLIQDKTEPIYAVSDPDGNLVAKKKDSNAARVYRNPHSAQQAALCFNARYKRNLLRANKHLVNDIRKAQSNA